MSDLPPMKEFPRRGRAGRRASAAAVLNHNPGESWTPDTVHRLNIDGGSGRRFSIAQIPEADEHKNSLEDLHLLPEKKMDYSLYPAMPADMHDSDDEKRVRKEKKSSFSEGGRRMSKRLSVVVSILMRGSISNKGTKNSVTEEQIIKVAPTSHHVEIEDEAEELHHPDVHYTCSDIWQHLRQFIPWILTVTSVLQICLYILDRDEFFRLLVFSPYRIVEVWRLFTYTLLHQNAIHLALNVVIQVNTTALN
ncbi:protein rhomboid-like [Sergentomyia squamirostris]